MPNIDHYLNLLSHAESLAEALQIELSAARPAKGILQGMRSSKSAGPGMDFREHADFNKEIHDPAHIDHKATAKNFGRILVRQNDDESPVRWVVWRAGSESMNFSSREGVIPTKREAADLLLLTAARMLLEKAQTAQVTLLNGPGKTYANRRQLSGLAYDLMETETLGSRLGSLDFNVSTLKPRTHAILFSDCINEAVDPATLAAELEAEPNPEKHLAIWARLYIAPIVRDIEYLHATGVKGHLVHLFDPAEWSFPYGKGLADGRIKFEFAAGSVTLPQAGDVRGDYLKRMRAIQQALHDNLLAYEWDYSVHVTDDPPGAGLSRLLGLPDQPRAKTFRPDSDYSTDSKEHNQISKQKRAFSFMDRLRHLMP